MKLNCTLIAGLFLTTSLIAQTNTNPAPSTAGGSPAPAVAEPTQPAAPVPAPAPAVTKKPSTKAAPKAAQARHPSVVEKPVTLVPGPAMVNGQHVNIRGRSTILSEALTRANKGDMVTVLEQVENKWAKGDDMKQWARIAYPSNATVWVFASLVDSNKTVTVPKLNLRGGPGENFSIVGHLTKGTTVKEISTKGEWMRIEPPANATAFIAAMYLKQDAAMLTAAQPATPAPPIEPATTNAVVDVITNLPTPVDVASTTGTNAGSADLNAFANEVAGTNATPAAVETPLPPRIVLREGIVSGNTSIQAPSYYSLVGMDTGRTINYLRTPSTEVHLGLYMGRHVIVQGEEALDERWPKIPVLTLQRIQVIDDKE
jgi:uncharacterized protein YgiM (DUF1202 family)